MDSLSGGTTNLLRMARVECRGAAAFVALALDDDMFATATYRAAPDDELFKGEAIDDLIRQAWNDPEFGSGGALVRMARLGGRRLGPARRMALAIVPLVDGQGNRPWGLLGVAGPEAGSFDARQIDLLERIAQRLSSYFRARQAVRQQISEDIGAAAAGPPASAAGPAANHAGRVTVPATREPTAISDTDWSAMIEQPPSRPPAQPAWGAPAPQPPAGVGVPEQVPGATEEPIGAQPTPPATQRPAGAALPPEQQPQPGWGEPQPPPVRPAEQPSWEAPAPPAPPAAGQPLAGGPEQIVWGRATPPQAQPTAPPGAGTPHAPGWEIVGEPQPPGDRETRAEAAPQWPSTAPAEEPSTGTGPAAPGPDALADLLRGEDPSTGLIPLGALLGRTGRMLGAAAAGGGAIALVVVEVAGDVDDDALLVAAHALRGQLRFDDPVARIGDRAFVAVVPLVPGSSNGRSVEEHLAGAVRSAVVSDGATVRATHLVADLADRRDADELLRQAVAKLRGE